MYHPECLDPFPPEVAEGLLEMALSRTGIARAKLNDLTAEERQRLDANLWRLVTAADIPDTPCGH